MKTTKIILSTLGATFFYFFARYYITHTNEPGFAEVIFLASIMAVGSFIDNFGRLAGGEGERDSTQAFVKILTTWVFGFVGTLLLVHDTSFLALLGVISLSIALTWINQAITES